MIATLRRLLALAETPLPRVALPALLGALAVVFGIGLMASAGYLISRAAERPQVLALATTIVVVRFFGLARPIARYAERITSHDLAFRVLAAVRVRAYRRIEPLAPAQLRSDRRGDLLARVVGDVDALQDLHLRGLGPPLVAVAAGAVAVGAAWALLPAAALVLAIGLLAGGLAVPALAGALGRRAARREADVRGQLSADLVELLEAAPELAVYGRQDEQLERLRDADSTLVRLARRAAAADGAADGLGLVVSGLTVAGVLALAVAAHADGQLDGVLVATLGLLALASFEAVQPLATAARDLERTLAAGRRVLELTDREPLIVDPQDPLPAPVAPFAVVLEGVRARYAPEQAPALDGFSLRLEPGRRVALLGASGAGKSTVANLLLRFLDPEAGRVTLAGSDLRAYRQHDVRAAIAVAGQDAHLFSTSIRDNLLLARPQATAPELDDVLRRVRLDGWVATLPKGLDTRVGERGGELSGGQRQRLVVARALLADAPVLVLDEPTAHLDAATASALMDDVMDAAGDRTVLLVTHRPEGLEHVDEVVVLEAPSGGDDPGI